MLCELTRLFRVSFLVLFCLCLSCHVAQAGLELRAIFCLSLLGRGRAVARLAHFKLHKALHFTRFSHFTEEENKFKPVTLLAAAAVPVEAALFC